MHCYLFPTPQWFIFAEGLPPLLYYSHLPAIAVSLIVGLFVFLNNPKGLTNRLLFLISIFFSIWVVANLVLWTNNNSDTVIFVWSFFGLLYGLISILSVYLVYVFLDKKDVSLYHKLSFFFLLLPIVIFTPTAYNLSGFNLEFCGSSGFEGLSFLAYYTSVGVVSMVWIMALLVNRYRPLKDAASRKQIVSMGIGIEFFLFSFLFTGFLASYLNDVGLVADYSLEQYGLFGMIVFMSFIAYMIVQFHAFNVGLLAAQALIVALVILIGAQFTFIKSTVNLVLNSIALMLTAAIGYSLIRSVRLEIEHREEIEKLAKTLDETNGRQETLIHFIGHEVKGFLTKDAGAFAALSEGDLGPLPETAKPFVASALQQSRAGADSVANILKASNLKKGTVSYDKKPFDMKELVTSAVERAKQMAADKKLELSLQVADGSYQMVGDGPQINDHVLRNLIENALNYTPAGTVAVSLKNEGGKVIFSVKDSGVGITDEDKKRLFTEGGHGAESQKVNAHSTGYGLYIAKQIVDAHGGSIRAESEGAGKGSTFIAEFPVSAA